MWLFWVWSHKLHVVEHTVMASSASILPLNPVCQAGFGWNSRISAVKNVLLRAACTRSYRSGMIRGAG